MITEYESGKFFMGAKFKTNEGYEVIIIGRSKRGKGYYWVKFNTDTGNVKEARSNHIFDGAVSNPMRKSVKGRGYIGEGSYKVHKNGNTTRISIVWRGIISRGYDDKFKKTHPSYIGCSVASEWHNFQNFAKWYDENYIEGYELDKDILIKGNKLYSPDTCVFVPPYINTLFIKADKARGSLFIGVRADGYKYAHGAV